MEGEPKQCGGKVGITPIYSNPIPASPSPPSNSAKDESSVPSPPSKGLALQKELSERGKELLQSVVWVSGCLFGCLAV